MAALLAAGCLGPSLAQAQVVVVANGSPITAYDIEQRTKLVASSTHTNPTRQQIIQDLIDDRIKIDKAKSYGLIVSDEEVNQAFEGMAQRQHITAEQFGPVPQPVWYFSGHDQGPDSRGIDLGPIDPR